MIGDDEFAWLENVMPIGRGNARTVPGPSAALATITSNCYYMAEGNISNVAYMYMFSVDGSCTQVNLTTYAKTTVGAAGKFAGSGTKIAQWKNERILIIDPTYGYFDWDGTTLTPYKGAIQSVTVASGGTGFTASATTTLTLTGGSGASAAFTCTICVNAIALHAAGGGSGYVVGDVLTLSGGTFTSAATMTVTAVSSGAITAFNLTTTGIYTVSAGTSTIACTGGHGTGATFDPLWGIYAVTVTNRGTGYLSTDVLVLTASGAGAGTAAVLTVNLAINSVGTSIATYAGRVWIGNNRTIVYSAPNTYNDFNPADLAGSFIMTDDTMRSSIIRLFSANAFLYVIGSNSINVISNVTVTAPVYTSTGTVITPSITVFSNSNITVETGTEMYDSVVPTGRTINLAVDYGFVGITGATPTKFSDELDGVFPLFDFTQAVSGGIATIFNIKCLCYLVKYNDPATGTVRQLLCVHFSKKWYFSSQVAAMTFIATASPDPDLPNLWATNGLNLYKLFSNTTNNLAQTIVTKLWDMGSPLITKSALKVGLETKSPTVSATLSVNVDTENSTQNYALTGSNSIAWKNNTGATISWTNNASAPIVWTAAGYLMNQQNVENVGNYLGLTTTSNNQGITYIGFHLQYEARTPWTTAS